MNIKQAKQIPIQTIVQHLGGGESAQKGNEVWYYSPFRPDEKTPSFKVNLKLNTWYDFGCGKGGSTLDLWLDFKGLSRMDGQSIKKALAELETFSEDNQNSLTAFCEKPERKTKPTTARFTLIKNPSRIWLPSLKEELTNRGISYSLASKYLKQAYFRDNESGKTLNGFAFKNDSEGWELSVPNPQRGSNFKTVIGKKAPTTFQNNLSNSVLVFEGFWDFLSFLEMSDISIPNCEFTILNSLSFVQQTAQNFIQRKNQVSKVLLFLDNDLAGENGTNLFAEILEPHGFTIGTMNHHYSTSKDLNEFLMMRQSKVDHSPSIDRPLFFSKNHCMK